jgi:hypothetical protein
VARAAAVRVVAELVEEATAVVAKAVEEMDESNSCNGFASQNLLHSLHNTRRCPVRWCMVRTGQSLRCHSCYGTDLRGNALT